MAKDKGAFTMDTKVPVPATKPSMGRKPNQPITGKLKGFAQMGATGQAVKTAPSNPITGPAKSGTSMGSGGIIDGFAR